MTASSRRPIDGVLMLDKPVGITSNAAIQRVKRALQAAKAGHVGTLDPMASGLLPVCLGEATKFSTQAFGADKEYEATVLLGVTTTTGDVEGEITARNPVTVTETQVAAALQHFTGEIQQTPPMYSALKRAGKPLYEYARAGQVLALEPRHVVIYEIVLTALHADRLIISVRCGKGTYIRVLAEDIGRSLGCGATLGGLRRVMVGQFTVAQAIMLGQFETLSEEARLSCLLPLDSLVSGLPELRLAPEPARCVRLGQAVWTEALEPVTLIRLYDREGCFLGLGELQAGGWLVPKRLRANPQP